MKADLEGVMDPELLQQYANGGDLEDALQNGGGGGITSTKSGKNKMESNSGKKRGKSYHGSKSNKKKKSQH